MSEVTTDLRGLLPEELATVLQSWGQPAYRAKQLFGWMQKQAVTDPAQMTNLPAALRELVQASGQLPPFTRVSKRVARDGTAKYLWQLADGECIESVLMTYRRATTRDRATVCISTQAGCALQCRFCATGQQGFRRNLSAGEIVGQVLAITADQQEQQADFAVTNVVLMGMGEPFLNYDAVRQAILLLNHPQGQALGQRRISVSTAGIVPGIERFTAEGWEVNLALSLHGADDETRSSLMPINQRYPLVEVMAACRRYWLTSKRRLTVEYALMAGINDRPDDARRLGAWFRDWPVHFNLIPVNPVAGSGTQHPGSVGVKRFAAELARYGIEAVVREERGTDIEAACGQLRGVLAGQDEGE
ncbi:23S rRNA (adenine(2503)-C(2))-methyltransferase RlmN [Heliophilum fasciatum]|uniref:Probable dual-specificity RNA methyltransferase RlmN n=1 Tax=Heliophilum fasciatum TaxID=35700 RepID=A0A4R2RUW6_9FIRM|nr:23S rRNA (adenine(2503)-C(2))-methyltransferase RlmN [Heliophilum fasciatum]MCW2277205.1 23S rRNA (adenine2503-C2)-methyltransferase [Heliophilum fasciatum]TCP68160.1 23S rRNA m(2)A-2503 methyltransferase [Heliophilum fasciatum]